MILDRVKALVERTFARLFWRLDYSCLYGATVASQNGDGTLELTPTGGKLPPLSNVPIRYGIPGIEVKVNPGALAIVGFEGGDPKAYYAFLVSTAGLQSLSFMGGTMPVARQGDAIVIYFGEAPIQFSGTISGLPATGVILIEPATAPGVILTGRADVTA